MAQEVKVLRKTLTKEEFTKRAFGKSKSIGSKAVVESSLISFDRFCEKVYGKSSDEIILQLRQNPGDELYHFLQDYVDFMAEELKPATIRAYFSFIRSYLRSQGIKLYSEDLKDLIRFPSNVKEMLEPLTKEQLRILLDNSKEDRKVLYLTLISSGMRVSEALSLKKKDFHFYKDPVLIRIPGIHTKTKQTRETFISREAKELVLRLVKDKSDDDLVFGTSHDFKKALAAEDRVFANLRIRCGLDEKYPDSRRHKITIHSMRAFFHTQASLVHDEQYANAMDGHQGYLMQYYRLSPEKRIELYQELEPYLCIYPGDSFIKSQKELHDKVRELEKQKEDTKATKQSLEDQITKMRQDFDAKLAESNEKILWFIEHYTKPDPRKS